MCGSAEGGQRQVKSICSSQMPRVPQDPQSVPKTCPQRAAREPGSRTKRKLTAQADHAREVSFAADNFGDVRIPAVVSAASEVVRSRPHATEDAGVSAAA